MALFSRRTAESTPLDGVDVVLADLDGVVYAGPARCRMRSTASTAPARGVVSATSPTTHRAPMYRWRRI